MSEMMKQGNENSLPVGEDLVKALVSKTIDIGARLEANTKAILETGETIRKLPDPGEIAEVVNFRMGKLDSDVGDLVMSMGRIQAIVQKMAGQTLLSPEDIDRLRQDLQKHAELFERPLKKTIHHTHFIGKPIWVLGGMGLLVVGLILCWYRSWDKANLHAKNDIKWRYVKQTHDSTVLKALQRTDDVYDLAPGPFRSDVEEEEERRQKLFDKMMVDSEARKDMRDLEGQEKRR